MCKRPITNVIGSLPSLVLVPIMICRLSLQYHPDKNKNKGAQEKFAEINNGNFHTSFHFFLFSFFSPPSYAHGPLFVILLPFSASNVNFSPRLPAYEILSDEEKKKNYDMYGDEKGNPGFGAGHPGDQGGYTYFTSGGPGGNQFSFRPGEWQSTGGEGASKSFSFSFGGAGGPSSFGFGMDDLFSNFFGGNGDSMFGGFGSRTGSRAGSRTGSQSGSRSSSKSIRAINSCDFKKEIAVQGMTWLLFSFTPSLKGNHYVESTVEEVASLLQGALKVMNIFMHSSTFHCLFISACAHSCHSSLRLEA